jgi:hypothetical protein
MPFRKPPFPETTMKSMFKAATIATLLAAGSLAHAGDESFDIDTKFRAKIAKEKVKQAASERLNKNGDQGIDNADCGSQNIGNVNTGGRPGSGPREVFVFAPNAINLVGPGGCR